MYVHIFGRGTEGNVSQINYICLSGKVEFELNEYGNDLTTITGENGFRLSTREMRFSVLPDVSFDRPFDR